LSTDPTPPPPPPPPALDTVASAAEAAVAAEVPAIAAADASVAPPACDVLAVGGGAVVSLARAVATRDDLSGVVQAEPCAPPTPAGPLGMPDNDSSGGTTALVTPPMGGVA